MMNYCLNPGPLNIFILLSFTLIVFTHPIETFSLIQSYEYYLLQLFTYILSRNWKLLWTKFELVGYIFLLVWVFRP